MMSGQNEATHAALGLEKVRRVAGLSGAYTQQIDGGTAICYGRYSGPDDPEAQRDLKRIRGMTIENQQPFGNAVLMPPSTIATPGSDPEYDLFTVKDRLGEGALYTLQVAVYKRTDDRNASGSDLAEFRGAAEEAVRRLRAEEIPAFYVHMPQSSSVTIGVFTEDDYEPSTNPLREPSYVSPSLRQWQIRFPHILVNGVPVTVSGGGGSTRATRPQSSILINIPSP